MMSIFDEQKRIREAVCLHRLRNGRRARRQGFDLTSPLVRMPARKDPFLRLAGTRSCAASDKLASCGSHYGLRIGPLFLLLYRVRFRASSQAGVHFALHDSEQKLRLLKRSFLEESEDLDFFSLLSSRHLYQPVRCRAPSLYPVFASPWTKGKQPLWPDSLLKRWVKPAAKRVGITKKVGWHTFRHTYSTLLRANGEDVKVVQELLRHANSKITMDVYTQALSPAKREAQGRVASSILPKEGCECCRLIGQFWTVAPKTEFRQVTEKNGGDDGTRTRGLCRDSAAWLGITTT